jgi:hypothetical protein
MGRPAIRAGLLPAAACPEHAGPVDDRPAATAIRWMPGRWPGLGLRYHGCGSLRGHGRRGPPPVQPAPHPVPLRRPGRPVAVPMRPPSVRPRTGAVEVIEVNILSRDKRLPAPGTRLPPRLADRRGPEPLMIEAILAAPVAVRRAPLRRAAPALRERPAAHLTGPDRHPARLSRPLL